MDPCGPNNLVFPNYDLDNFAFERVLDESRLGVLWVSANQSLWLALFTRP